MKHKNSRKSERTNQAVLWLIAGTSQPLSLRPSKTWVLRRSVLAVRVITYGSVEWLRIGIAASTSYRRPLRGKILSFIREGC